MEGTGMWMKITASGAWTLALLVLHSCVPESDRAGASPEPAASVTWTEDGDDALRAIIETYREDIRLLESDSATRSKYVDPDSVAAIRRAELADMEAVLEVPIFTLALADSLLTLVQMGIAQIRDSGQASAYINGEPHTLADLLKADSALREVITEMHMYPDEIPPGR